MRARLAASGQAQVPKPGRPAEPAERLFAGLILSNPARARAGRSRGLPVSVVAHALAIAALVLVPILWPVELPEQRDYIRALLYDPPPPPPAPLPKGQSLSLRPAPARPVTPASAPSKPDLDPPVEAPTDVPPLVPEAKLREAEQFGIATGSELGIAEGMEEGVEGGVVGGVPGGVLGGVLGGTGDIPVPVRDYDRPPRLVRHTRPEYPREAFAKKVEGVVVVELLIDAGGRVARARVTQSIPLLDAAALEAVRHWVFEPALKHGRPVPTIALAPVSFRIL